MSLVESLVALAISTFGVLATLGLQNTMRFHSDLARQHAEASHLAQARMESARAFVRLSADDPAPTLDDVDTEDDTPLAHGVSNTHYTLTQTVRRLTAPARVELVVTVHWTDRRGERRDVQLHSLIAAVDPALAALPAIAPEPVPLRHAHGRAGGIPIGARDRGDGRSVWAPPGARDTAWVFDNTSGLVQQTCSGDDAAAALAGGDVAACLPTRARIVAGVVRLAAGIGSLHELAPPGQAGPAPTFDLALQLEGATAATCFDDAPAAPAAAITVVHYACLAPLDAKGQWSGRLIVVPVGWTLGDGRDSGRICRLGHPGPHGDPADTRDDGLHYEAVAEHLTHQNLLIVRGDAACPDHTQDEATR